METIGCLPSSCVTVLWITSLLRNNKNNNYYYYYYYYYYSYYYCYYHYYYCTVTRDLEISRFAKSQQT